MNIVNSGEKFMVYGDDVRTYKELPAKTYMVGFQPMAGFYLSLHNDLSVKEKIYGSYARKVHKVMNSFKKFDRNMGVILSGPKGVGKSMFARLVAEEGNKNNLPVIIVADAYSGLGNFISSIQQECIVFFDEFEKIFKIEENNDNPQDELLSLFDGVDNGKKLYIITCNTTAGLSEYLINRPGRFHYHFVLGTPTESEVREYMEDNLVGEARKYINKIVELSNVMVFTYDVLRAITFDLNQGYELSETLLDLNIEREPYLEADITLRFSNGLIAKSDRVKLDMINNVYMCQDFIFEKDSMPVELRKHITNGIVSFYTNDITTDEGGYHIDLDRIEVDLSDNWQYMPNGTDEEKKARDFIMKFTESCTLEKVIIEKHRIALNFLI